MFLFSILFAAIFSVVSAPVENLPGIYNVLGLRCESSVARDEVSLAISSRRGFYSDGAGLTVDFKISREDANLEILITQQSVTGRLFERSLSIRAPIEKDDFFEKLSKLPSEVLVSALIDYLESGRKLHLMSPNLV